MDHRHSRATATAAITACSLSGAVSSSAYLFSPWADQLGGAG